MKHTKKLLSLLLVLCLVLSLSCTAFAVDEAKPLDGKTVILHSNDVHGAIDLYAAMASLKADYAAQGAEVILADAGDYSQGTVYVSVNKGADAVTMMNATGYDVAAEGIVLLRNNGILPLAEGRKILLTGRFTEQIPRTGGSTSSSAEVLGYDNVTLTAALREVYGDAVRVVEKPSREELAAADVVLLSTGTIDVESFERPFALPKEEEAFIRTAVESNPNTIVLVNSGSGIRMGGWNDKAAAVIYGWYPGQSGFTALADILSGKLSPSGKLPMTIEKEFNDSPAKGTMPAGAEFYNKAPRAYNERLIQLYDIDYKESVLVGYRWYETKGIAPLYPFGFGLSYTTFELSKPRAPKAFPADKPLKVSVTLTNTGDREGAEVVQLYVTENAPTVLRPKKELKGFRKVTLAPGKSAVVEFELDRQALAFWDTQSRGWKVNPGEYTLSLGTSSADIAATLPVSVK